MINRKIFPKSKDVNVGLSNIFAYIPISNTWNQDIINSFDKLQK